MEYERKPDEDQMTFQENVFKQLNDFEMGRVSPGSLIIEQDRNKHRAKVGYRCTPFAAAV